MRRNKVQNVKPNTNPKEKTKLRRGKAAAEPAVRTPNDIKTFFDMNLPGYVKITPSYIIQDGIYRSFSAIRSYPSSTNETAILSRLGEMAGVTLHVYARELTNEEEARVIQNATNKNKMVVNTSKKAKDSIEAADNYDDVLKMIRELHKEKDTLVHTSVFIEVSGSSKDELDDRLLAVASELKYMRINVDALMFRQEQGYLSCLPGSEDMFHGEFSRALPSISVANLYPYSYSGKSDPHGFPIGRDRNGSYIIADLDKRDSTHSNSNVLILGNSGQGKSYLTKGLICNLVEGGKRVIILDPEHEYEDLVRNLGGDYLDLMEGRYMINVLEPKTFTRDDDDMSINDDTNPEIQTFRTKGALSQHISFLRDFFRTYKALDRAHLDVLELILTGLYKEFGITNQTNMRAIPKDQFPTMTDLWNYTGRMLENYNPKEYMFSMDMLRDVRLALESICTGSQSQYFDGHTNVRSETGILGFGLKGVMDADQSLRNAMLFNVLSYMSNELLNQGNTCAILDEFYLFLSSQVSVEYTRNCMKRVRKFNSMMIIASQNLEDFLRPEIESYTKPLVSIPIHRFLFNPGQADSKAFINMLQLEENEYNLIQTPNRGHCLYCCGNERYNLDVSFPDYKAKLFGNAGGR